MKNLIKSFFRKPCKQSNNSVIKIKFCSAHQLLNNPSCYPGGESSHLMKLSLSHSLSIIPHLLLPGIQTIHLNSVVLLHIFRGKADDSRTIAACNPKIQLYF